VAIAINCDVCVFDKENKKKCFCVLSTTNIITCFERFFLYIYKKILEVLKMCFHMDFLNTIKIIFLHFWILQHVCKTPKGIGKYFKKIQKSYLEGNSYIIHR